LAEALVFELSQSDAEDPVIAPRLAELRALGFSFSMDNVRALDLNFDSLAERQFRFVKLEAEKLLSGRSQAKMAIHISDLKEAMKRAGIDLIAEKVEHEPEVVGLLEFNVDLGQGYLFGEPMPARDSA
jgi:cyclic-di-GMP phosphodiesterase TipF (flagellum assembly factor)